VINRLAGNPFAMKGWAITIVAALLVLASNASNSNGSLSWSCMR